MQGEPDTTVVGCPVVPVVPMTRMPGTRDGSWAAVPWHNHHEPVIATHGRWAFNKKGDE